MKNVTPLRLGVFGAVWCVGGFAWFAFWFVYVRIPDSPAITIDQNAPMLPRIVELLGVLMVLTSLAWAVMARIQKRRIRSRE
jgi:hypothetical protein